jgi:hypothetical protein
MNLADELERLDQLRRSGALTDDEFERAKTLLLQGTPPAADPDLGDHLADQLAEVKAQNELARIDREWEIEREQYMIVGRYGRRHVPTTGMGIATAVIGGGFGIFWTIMAFSIASGPVPGPAGGIGSIFPLFGVVFIAVAVGWGIYCMNRAQKYEEAYQAYRARRAAATGEREG